MPSRPVDSSPTWVSVASGTCSNGRPCAGGGLAEAWGLSDEDDITLVVRDRCGACADQIAKALDTVHLTAVCQPVLRADAALRTDGSPALAAAARHMNFKHHAINVSASEHARGPWHINNVNARHSRLTTWLRRFNNVASSYLRSNRDWFRGFERFRTVALAPIALLDLAVEV